MSKRRLDRSTYGDGQSFSSDQYLKFADYEIEIMYQPLTIKTKQKKKNYLDEIKENSKINV